MAGRKLFEVLKDLNEFNFYFPKVSLSCHNFRISLLFVYSYSSLKLACNVRSTPQPKVLCGEDQPLLIDCTAPDPKHSSQIHILRVIGCLSFFLSNEIDVGSPLTWVDIYSTDLVEIYIGRVYLVFLVRDKMQSIHLEIVILGTPGEKLISRSFLPSSCKG